VEEEGGRRKEGGKVRTFVGENKGEASIYL
jgi:hypothetical protein